MKPGARVQAAIDILAEFDAAPRPLERILKDWGRKNRYAGSKDRRAIGELTFGVMRQRGRLAEQIGEESPRALMIAHLSHSSEEDWQSWFDGSDYAPQPLTTTERELLEAPTPITEATARANVPDWLLPDLKSTFGAELDRELMAMEVRASIDLRVNQLKTSREEVITALASEGITAQPTPHAEHGLRILQGPGERPPNVEQSAPFKAGLFEVQDEGSQIAALLADARPGEQVIDLCAGAGGKTLALAAAMQNKGQIFACDVDETKLGNLKRRLTRASVRNVQVRTLRASALEEGSPDPDLEDLQGSADLVLIDAPCSGSGTWRRHPDAKWRLTNEALDTYCTAQAAILLRAARLVKPGGRIVYVTCSILARENQRQILQFLRLVSGFDQQEIDAAFNGIRTNSCLQLAPHVTGTDGFFIGTLCKGTQTIDLNAT